MAETTDEDARARPDAVEEAGETTAAASTPTTEDTRPVGEGTLVDVEGEGESG